MTRACFLSIVLVGIGAAAAEPGLLLYAPFDQDTTAVVAGGDPRGRGSAGGRTRELEDGRGGPWSRVVAVPKDGTEVQLRYDALGNADPQRGTIAFFARVDEFGKHWQEHRFVVLGADPYKNGLVLGLHPQDQYLIFSWCFNQTTGWFHVGSLIRKGELFSSLVALLELLVDAAELLVCDLIEPINLLGD